MIQSTKQSSHKTSEIVSYHKVKRKFLSLTDMEKRGSGQTSDMRIQGSGL